MSFSIAVQKCQPYKDDVSRARVMSVGQRSRSRQGQMCLKTWNMGGSVRVRSVTFLNYE